LRREDLSEGVPPEFFGLHIHHLDVPYKQGVSSWPFTPFGSWRLFGAYVQWDDLEPQKGQWNFRRLDWYVEEAGRHGIELLLTLGRTPQWASARPNEDRKGSAAEPASIEDWKNYVRTLSRRYKGRIKYYEVWNEPRLYELEDQPPGGKVGYYRGS
jgi:beta-glucosidase/6-phospho-beta-glucosidase/beta-galactosidase